MAKLLVTFHNVATAPKKIVPCNVRNSSGAWEGTGIKDFTT